MSRVMLRLGSCSRCRLCRWWPLLLMAGCWWLVALVVADGPLLLTLLWWLAAGCDDAKTMPERCQNDATNDAKNDANDAKTMPERCQKNGELAAIFMSKRYPYKKIRKLSARSLFLADPDASRSYQTKTEKLILNKRASLYLTPSQKGHGWSLGLSHWYWYS